jgi:hypothetical protein
MTEEKGFRTEMREKYSSSRVDSVLGIMASRHGNLGNLGIVGSDRKVTDK